MELQNQLKQMAAKAALEYVVEGEYLGVGTGTTVGFSSLNWLLPVKK